MGPYGVGPRGYGGGPPRPPGLPEPPEQDDLYGLRLEDFLPPEQIQPETQPVSRGDQILALLGQSMQGTETPAPQGFGQGLLSGLFRGLGGEGLRRQGERQKIDQAAQQRAQASNAANLEASRAYRTARVGAVQDRGKEARTEASRLAAEGRAEARDIAKFNREAPERERKERMQTATAARAQATADRAVSTQERQARLAQVQTVGGLSDDYRLDPAIKGYQTVRSNLNTAETAAKQKSGPGDIALVFSFMRALEPENPNAVREGEYDNARQATGLFQQFKNLPARYFQGNQLTPTGREYFLSQMRATLQSRREDYDQANDQYGRRAEAGGVDPSLFIREYAPTGSTGSRTRPPLSSFMRP